MKKNRLARRGALAVSLCLTVLLTACGSSDDGGSSADLAKGDGVAGKNIYLVGVGDVNPWTKVFNGFVIDGLKKKGAKVTYLQDPLDVQIEVQNLNRAVAAKPDLILLLGLDYRSLVPGLTRAKQANVPVINMVSPTEANSDLVVSSIESNHVDLGKFAAQNIIEGLKKQGRTTGNVIAITGTAGTSQVVPRLEGFKKELATVPGLKLVAVEDGNWDQTASQKIAQQLFAKYDAQGGVVAAFGMADNQSLGIIQAAKQAGLTVGGDKGLIVSSSNCYTFGLEAVKAGEIYGTATQSPKEESAFTLKNVDAYFAGEKLAKRLYSPESRITSSNVQGAIDKGLCP